MEEKTVREKKKKYGNWTKENSTEAWKEYNKSKQNAERVIYLAKEKKQNECASDLNIQTGLAHGSWATVTSNFCKW